MAIFDNNFLFESSTSAEEFTVEADMSVEATMESVVEMNAALNEGVYALNTSLYIADLVMEQSGQTALLEASLGDFWEKTKARFKEIWEKIKGFFKNLLQKMDIMFQGSEKFIKKYEKVISKINSNNKAEYAVFNEEAGTHHLDPAEMISLLGNGEVNSGFAGRVKDVMTSIEDMQKMVNSHVKMAAKIERPENDKTIKENVKEREQAVYQKISHGASDAKACKKEFKALLRGKSAHAKNITDKKMINEMLTYCKKWIADGKKNVIRSQREMDRLLGECMKSIDAFKLAQTKAAKDNKSVMGVVTEAISAMNRMVGIGNYINGISFDTFNGCFRTYVGMLKSFVSKNSKLIEKDLLPKKESYTDSVLDSIMSNF